jgi:hypothetical protein
VIAVAFISRRPLDNGWSDTRLDDMTRSNNNKTVSEATASNAAAMTFRGRSTGRHYWETRMTVSGTFNCAAGVRREDEDVGTAVNLGKTMAMRSTGALFAGDTGASTGTGASFADTARIMHAIDLGAAKYWIGVNGTWANSGNPAAGTGALFAGFPAGVWCPYVWTDNDAAGSHVITIYNGQVEDAMLYTPPDGFERGMRF